MSKATRKKAVGIVKSDITRKEYVYTLDGVQLKFTLRQDNTSELVIWKKLMESAMKDVESDIATIKKGRKV